MFNWLVVGCWNVRYVQVYLDDDEMEVAMDGIIDDETMDDEVMIDGDNCDCDCDMEVIEVMDDGMVEEEEETARTRELRILEGMGVECLTSR